MHQAAVLDSPALDALTLQQDGLPPAEIDISQGQIVQAWTSPQFDRTPGATAKFCAYARV
jgi:hypothetical protein